MRIDGLNQKLGYDFKDDLLIQEALRHSSFVNELGQPEIRDNERLEFLGDAVLNLVIGHLLMEVFPDLNQGDLSRMRATLVNESQLAGQHRVTFDGSALSSGVYFYKLKFGAQVITRKMILTK